MDGNHQRWYQDNNQYSRSEDRHQSPDVQPNGTSGVAADSVQNAQRLLAVYPMAATPVHHVVSHIGNLTMTAAPPSFIQPSYYAIPHSSYPQGNPPPYSEYDHQLAYLSSSQTPQRSSGYWENTRNDAVRLLGEGSSRYSYQDPANWRSHSTNTNFETTPFVQSIFQQTAPNNVYPTPPPGITNSSSSLAFALGPPAPQPQPQVQRVYRPEESASFFDEFVERKSREMNVGSIPTHQIRSKTPPPKVKQAVEESPDPLAINSNQNTFATTPRKRKAYVEIESPSIKRIQSMKFLPSVSVQTTPKKQMLPPITPSSASSSTLSVPVTPTPKRIVNLAYVAVPPKPWLTPSSSHKSSIMGSPMKKQGKMKISDTPDDLGGYGSEEGSPESPYRQRGVNDSIKSSSRRTGDRDERAPLEKFTALVEDLFEAEDSLPNDASLDDLSDFFSPLTIDYSHPLLNPNLIRKLTKYIGQVTRPTKRLRQSGGVLGTPRGKGRMADADTQILARLLKLLDRSVRAGEDVDPFFHHVVSSSVKASPRKAAAKKAAKAKKSEMRSSQTPPGEDAHDDDDDNIMAVPQTRDLTDFDFDKLSKILDTARDSILAADCCISLLGSDRLTKQLYSEELITACLNTIKNQLTKIIYPFVEASADSGLDPNNNPMLYYIVKHASSGSKGHRRQLSEIFQALSGVLPKINNLVNAETVSMSDSIIIQAVYIAIGPFFVVDAGDESSKGKKDNVVLKTLGTSAMRGLRLDALSLIRSIFANHEDQRSWIIEEILTSLIKLSDTKQKAGQFRLRDGRSIRTVSALLLQLVQTSAHDVRIEAKKIDKARQNKFALRRQESFTESQQQQQPSDPFLDEQDLQEIYLYTTGLESATKAAKTIILFLTQRSGKGKATKNSNEAEYRTIFDNLIVDLLSVLYWPEWPAAGLLLSIACKYMVSSLDDVRSNNQADSNAAKTIALDHLGVIAARIRSSALKVQQDTIDSGPKPRVLKPLDEIVLNQESKALDKLLAAHRDVSSHLCKRSSEDQTYDSARELTAATLGQELATALKQVNSWIEEPDTNDDLNIKDESKMLSFGLKIKTALRDVWKDPSTDVFDIGSQEEVIRVDHLSTEIGTIQSLRNSFQPILTTILTALDAPAIFMRTKALRALGQIVTSDATILSSPNVRRGIESHLLDSSPAVRDAAVELIGKYMIDSPEVAGDYYQKIADRIADTGLSVRKRVIKLLKAFYSVTSDNTRRIDIATRLVLRMLDEDDTVKDLAIKSIEEIWFPSTSPPPAIKSRPGTSNFNDRSPLLAKVAVIMGTSANFKDRQSPLEDVLHKIMVDKEGSEAGSLHARYTEICETLIDGLVDASDLPGFTVINCIRTIYLFSSAYPSILSGSNASTLLPYLKNATSAEELATSDYLLKIFRVSIPHMPKTVVKFGQQLQSALQPMIVKPSSGGGVQILQETVGCMCTVVQYLTHDFVRLVNLLKSCNARLQQAIKRPVSQSMTANEIRPLLILIFIVALLGENCHFDSLRSENTALAPEINNISQGPIVEHIYNSLMTLYEKYNISSLRGRILQCLGFLFRAQPTLMTTERSANVMDGIFASPEEESRGRLLKIMQDFLISEAAKHSAKEKENTKGKQKTTDVNMDELVGNTDGFADSGVSSAIVQRYLEPILSAALSQNMQIQGAAIDVLSFTIKQGLAHPLQSFPVIVALETSPVANLSNRASALHAVLHSKHASLLNTRYTHSARMSFDYQKKISPDSLRGFRLTPFPVALLQRWYSLVREKRPTRQDFLKALVKVFQEPSMQASQDDVDFTRYMTENFSAFEYKTQEEVITVIKYLTTVLSTTGMQLLEIISPSHLLSHLHDSSQPTQPPQPTSQEAELMNVDPPSNQNQGVQPNYQDKAALMRSSVIIAMVMLLKAHLKTLYSLSEDKCNKFVIGKKNAIGDKPAVKRNDNPISWERLPFATAALLTNDDAEMQKIRFLEIWNADGLTAEPEEDFI